MQELSDPAKGYLKEEGLANFSPKYLAIMERIRESPGPALVYSQFKTLEGVGIFAAALRASEDAYVQLDIVKDADGQWRIPDEVMADPLANRYVLYTGDQDLE